MSVPFRGSEASGRAITARRLAWGGAGLLVLVLLARAALAIVSARIAPVATAPSSANVEAAAAPARDPSAGPNVRSPRADGRGTPASAEPGGVAAAMAPGAGRSGDRPAREREARVPETARRVSHPSTAGPVPTTADPSGRAAFDEGFFELVADHLSERPLLSVLVDDRGAVLLPVRQILEHLEVPVERLGERLVLEWPRGVWRTTLDLERGTMQVGEAETRALEPGSWFVRDGMLHLAPDVLASVLDAAVTVVWSDLVVQVDASRLPIGIRALREGRRLAGPGAGLLGPDPNRALPFDARSGGLAATWGVSTSAAERGMGGSAHLAIGGSLWGGATELEGTAAFGRGGRGGLGDLGARFTRPVFGTPWLRSFEVGSVRTRGAVSHRIFGAILSNEPYTDTRYFGQTAVAPAVPTGWEAEIYQGGHLVGVSDGTRGEGIDAHLNYGSNPVRVRLLGPAGQERVQDLLFVVDPRQVPAGELRYDVGVGACVDEGCASRSFGHLRYGVRSWMTVGAGAEHEHGAAPGTGGAHLIGSLVVRPRHDLSADVSVEPGSFLQAGAEWRPSLRHGVSGSYTWSAPEAARGLVGWQARMNATTVLPLPGGARSVNGHLLLQGRERGAVEAWRAGLSVPVGRSLLSADLESGLQPRDALTLRTFTSVGTVGRVFRDLALDASLQTSMRGVEMAFGGISFRPLRASTLKAGLELRRGHDPRLTLAVSTRAPFAFLQARGVSGERGSVTTSMDGGIAFDEGLRDPSFLGLPATGHAGVVGRVFHDLDGDGRWSPDEPAASGVRISVGGQWVESDHDGFYRLWGVRPYEAVAVAVDTLRLDFDLVPAERQEVLRPSPNLFNRVDVALLRTRELVGRVESGVGGGFGGVTVEVVDAAGVVVATSRTFSDGAIYIQRVPAGAYTVRVAESSLLALGASSDGLAVVVPSGSGEAVEVPALRVERDR